MTNEQKERLNRSVSVPSWVMAVTFVLCWGFGIALAYSAITGDDVHNRGLVLATAIYLIVWPRFQTSPKELISRLFPR